MMTHPSFINDPGLEVPENKILIIPNSFEDDSYKYVIESLIGNTKRDWFNHNFYYCLPLTIGNQYGFIIKSSKSFTASWEGGESPALIKLLHDETDNLFHSGQVIDSHFGNGIITFQNRFSIKTPPNINVMTIQPPNFFIPGTVAMTGVIETDQLRRDFTFNLKITIPNYTITVKKGDPVGAFIPIPRYFVDKFSISHVRDYFSEDIYDAEVKQTRMLGQERKTTDREKHLNAGRRYFNGIHVDDTKFKDHQKHI